MKDLEDQISLIRTEDGNRGMSSTAALEALQTAEQRQVLDTISELRTCGLDNVLSLPQLVVCGDQSAGKSSVLEALTEIPFPRKDNLCTRFPTEIILRRGATESLTIRIIPSIHRAAEERVILSRFIETIPDLHSLPTIMDKAAHAMGIGGNRFPKDSGKAFAMDVLVVEIEGPNRPQFTVVDLPGIIQAETKDASQTDVEMAVEITKSYISSPRTICLAVVSAANDYANQPILSLVRKYDPKGERTLGIITKPDRLPPGSESETTFLELARNEDIVFDLGWHVLKNRSFEESAFSILDRNASEERYFQSSRFCHIGSEQLGINAHVARLSRLFFAHTRQELPRLHKELEEALSQAKTELVSVGDARTDVVECKAYLTRLSLAVHEVCKAAVSGYYEGEYFRAEKGQALQDSLQSVKRLRAVVQLENKVFSDEVRLKGHKFHILEPKAGDTQPSPTGDARGGEVQNVDDEESSAPLPGAESSGPFGHIDEPKRITHENAIQWVNNAVTQARGRELPGNFNPLVVAELFWEQSSKWHLFAVTHINHVSGICRSFLGCLLKEYCPPDIQTRLWSNIKEQITARSQLAEAELDRILAETRSYPINYNHYYTDTIKKRQIERRKLELQRCLERATRHVEVTGCSSDHTFPSVNLDLAMQIYSEKMDPDMDKHSSELVLDCLRAIYKVYEKAFVANITVQVIERHVIRGLEHIFSPVAVSQLPDTEVLKIASESDSTKQKRDELHERVEMLSSGRVILAELGSRMLN